MSEKQLLAKYQKERLDLEAEIGRKQTRLSVLDSVIDALRMVLGETPAPAVRRTSTTATGTKALILDVLASGRRLNRYAIANAIKVKPVNVSFHLGELVRSGDVQKHGKSRATTYGVA